MRQLHLDEGESATAISAKCKAPVAVVAQQLFDALLLPSITLTPLETYLVPPEWFAHRSPFFLELADETRAAVIKRAHDLSASVIEIHSHPSQLMAAFSESDIRGFYEFVPHMLWRLKNRPYAAVVVARNSFDSLAWFESVDAPVPMAIRLEDGAILQPTGTTHSTWGQEDATHE